MLQNLALMMSFAKPQGVVSAIRTGRILRPAAHWFSQDTQKCRALKSGICPFHPLTGDVHANI
jgi:hypothetical protein